MLNLAGRSASAHSTPRFILPVRQWFWLGWAVASVLLASRTSLADSSALAGQWVGELAIAGEERSALVLDLGVVGARWVGEFDLVQVGVENYPVGVQWVGEELKLHFAGIDADFAGSIASDGQSLVVTPPDEEPLTLKRAGDAQFSASFLALEAAADDSTRVAALSHDGAELQRRFNADHEQTRLVILLSPT